MTSIINDESISAEIFGTIRYELRSNCCCQFFNKELSPSDNCRLILFTCFCPCIQLGRIKTIISREESFNFTCCGESIGIGKKGCVECCEAALFAIVGWPLAPVLGIYSYFQRRNLRIIYGTVRDNALSWKDSCHGCLWPCAILQHKTLLEKRRDSGLLRFDWEYSIFKDIQKEPLPRRDLVFAIVGLPAVGKSELQKKMIGASLGTNYTYHKDTKVRIGYKPIQVSQSNILFLEIWDVPVNDIMTIKLEIPLLNGIILTFDPNDENSFQFIKSFYESNMTLTNFYCIATKEDLLLNRKRDHMNKDTKKRIYNDPILDLKETAVVWANQNNIPFFSVSLPNNSGYFEFTRFLIKENAS